MSTKIKVHRDSGITTLRLNDPASMNALTPDMARQLRSLMLAEAETARVLILAGSDRAFSTGANLNAAMPDDLAGFDAGETLEQDYNPLMETLRDLPVPVISAVRGAVAGVGTSISLACDIIIAGHTAYFLEAFARVGLVPDGGATWILTRAVGRVRAMEMMLLAEKIPAQQALDWGLITRVVDDAEVEATAIAMARRLAQGPSHSYRLIRKAAWSAADSDFSTALATERNLQKQAGQSADFAEGLAAFQQKRPARFHS